jgi:predicted  nucleic acid-binding Zn-ribbon protein
MLIVVGLAIGVALRGAAQSPQRTPEPQERDVLPALLTEVRGLRVAMERMASAGPRVQLALGRLQLQEQRVNNLLRRLETVRSSLGAAQREEGEGRRNIAGFEDKLKSSMTDLATGKHAPGIEDQVKQIEGLLLQMKQRQAGMVAEVQRLQLEESGVAQEIAAEQGRWTDINQRLEDLERTLPGSR